MTHPQMAQSTLIYAKEVLCDRINVYQVEGENSFAALDFVISFLVRVEDCHVFAELWGSADPATERMIGQDPALGSVRTIFTEREGATTPSSRHRVVLAHETNSFPATF